MIMKHHLRWKMQDILGIQQYLLYILSQDLLGGIVSGIYSLDFNIEIELTNYILVLIIFAISYVFKYGYQIQLDSKGTMYGNVNE